MRRIAIFTTFSDALASYSLNRVVQDQIKMFLRHDYKPIVIVAENFQPIEEYKNVELRFVPLVPCHNEVKKDPTFDNDVDKIYDALKENLKDIDVVVSHDIVYQPAALKHNMAARRLALERPELKWLHWIHSATSPYKLNKLLDIFKDKYLDIIQKPFPNSLYVFFNRYSEPRIANNFEISRELVKTVHHPSDLFAVLRIDDPLVRKLADTKKFFEAEAVCVYPIRLDRGKQVEYILKTMAALKEFKFSVRIVIVDFQSTGGDKITYRDELKGLAIDLGLTPQEITFTSEVDEKWRLEVPYRTVMELFSFSNVFIMPSVSESYSLITQEFSVITGGVLVLNQDFPPFRDIFGVNAIFRKYSSGIDVMTGMDGWTKTEYGGTDESPEERKDSEKKYHYATAGMIANQLRNNQGLARQIFLRWERNLDTVFKKEIEPLLYG